MNDLYIDENLIEIDLNLNNKEEIIKKLSNILETAGLVKETYQSAVLKREKEFPTALETESIGFAIPHTDPQYVNKAAVAVARLKNTVNFISMENYEKNIAVKLVFLLAITDPSKQVKVLQKLIKLMQNKEIVNTILRADNQKKLSEILKNNF
ncbi:PTS sugar transporter subunit IIA [Halanaerobium salsuginis]|uniref:PTS system IIA component, Gat family n=1 Tax=Halanaerobium salsuginis TaxID=29563 RepID=A0A1I4JKL3_9FIRM|nr:PTS sugar transporter subunit IIA [Halanaerobium salsuginis]SFL66821.1 PTS system IIA component, Gat family [Halanaerobium salsuginis]